MPAFTFFIVLCAASTVAAESFESDVIPAGWRADASGDAAISSDRFKSGARSLRWTWRAPGAVLEAAATDGSVAIDKDGCLAFWVHNDTPMEDVLRLELLHKGDVIGRCWYALNFKGWRPLGAPYGQLFIHPEQFLVNGPKPPMCDGFRLIAPRGAAKGRLHVDYVDFSCRDELRPDNQQPWVGRPEVLLTGTPEKFLYSSDDISRNRSWLPRLVKAEEITPEDHADMATIRERVLVGDARLADVERRGSRLLQPDPAPQADPTVLQDCIRLLDLRRSPEGILTGRPIIPSTGPFTWKFNNPPDGVLLSEPPYVEATKSPLMIRLVRAYLHEKTRGSADRAAALRQTYFDLCDHLLDQGFAEGNNNISRSGFDVGCIVAMREELEETGRLREMLLAAAACGLAIRGDVLMIEDWTRSGYSPRNTDFFRDYRRLLVLTALLPDDGERLQRLRAYSRAVNCLCDPGLGEPYAWDGTGHHHPMFHLAYTWGVLFDEAYHLSGTQFRIGSEALATLKRSLDMLAFMGGPSMTVPPNLPGYTGQPLGMGRLLPTLALKMSWCDTESMPHAIDRDAAGTYLAIVGENATDTDATRFRELGIAPHRLEGHLSLNGAAAALHRRDHWLVSIAGEHKFRNNHEANVAYIGSNFNHSSRNGSVFVVSTGDPPSPWTSGFSLEGWDPRLVPGTTSYLAEDEVRLYRRKSIPRNVFGGGTSIDGDGIWGLDFLHESDVTPDNLRFRKSAFCFGGRITLITTDIARGPGADEAERAMPVVTTLYQNAFGAGGETEFTKGEGRFGFNPPMKPPPVAPEDHPCWMNGERVSAFPFSGELSAGSPRWLVDNKRTGYYVPADAPPLRLARRAQQWTYFREYWAKPHARFPKGDPRNYKISAGNPDDYEPTTDTFAVAWFEHGATPVTTDCVYTLIPETTPDAMAAFSRSMASADDAPFVILQKDSHSHVLHDRPSDTTGYILFGAGPVTAPGPLREVNRPCAVMVRKFSHTIRLSVASTDLDEWPGWAEGRIRISGDLVLALDGEWKRRRERETDTADAEADVSHVGGTTVLRIPYRTFLPMVIALEPARG